MFSQIKYTLGLLDRGMISEQDLSVWLQWWSEIQMAHSLIA